MQIETTRGNKYSYIRQTNEIVCGYKDDCDYNWNFEPLNIFTSMPEVNMFIISITEQCNLRCRYCCYSGDYKNNRSHSYNHLTSTDIDDIYSFIKNIAKDKSIRIAFYGGEPLLNFSLIQYAISKGKEIWGNDIIFSISTNGTTLTFDRIEWLIENKVELFISIDGTKMFHDRNRVDALGNGSYTKVYEALSSIKNAHENYLENCFLQMTLSSYEDLGKIAEEWHNDSILKDIPPSNIHGLSPNFAVGVHKVVFEDVKSLYIRLLELYEKHPDWLVLKVFFDQTLAYWKNRPIVDAGEAVPMATCMPVNTKLFIDTKLQIGVCEKVADNFRIGNVHDGINWDFANDAVKRYYDMRKYRCRNCAAVRMCDMCLTAWEYNDEQWNILCHNERIYAKVFMTIFCEMAERGMLS